MGKRSRLQNGDGDECPLFPAHGYMQRLPNSNPPSQWCPAQEHDGKWDALGKMPKSRSRWPYYGFEDTVTTYMRRLDRAITLAGDHPDAVELEV